MPVSSSDAPRSAPTGAEPPADDRSPAPLPALAGAPRVLSRLPHWARVLAVWAGASALTLLILRLGAQDTPATVWAGAKPSWTEHISFWDSGWYERIAREGYPAALTEDEYGQVQQNSWAFLPLLPYLAGLLSWTGLSFYARAALVSIAASAATALAMDRWLAPRVGRTASLWAVALAWSSPCAAVLQVPYAESLGLALTGLTLFLAGRGQFLTAIPAAALAAFARPIGVPLAAALGLWWLWELAQAHDWIRPGTYSRLLPGTQPLPGRERPRLLALALSAGAVTLVWPALAWAATGRRDAYTATEASWRGGTLVPVQAWFVRGDGWVGEHLNWMFVACIVIIAVALLSVAALRRLGPPAWFWSVAYCLYLLVFFDPMSSLLRILLPLLPAAWALSASLRTTRTRLALLALGILGQLFWVSWVWDSSISVRWVP